MARFLLLLFLPVCLSQADPTCAHGLVAGTACCAASCGTCGGPNCGKLSGGSADCCVGSIAASNRSCAALPAPCTLAPPPAPPRPAHALRRLPRAAERLGEERAPDW